MKNIALTVAFLFLATASASALETDDYGFPQWETAASGPVAPVVNWNNFPQPFANVRANVRAQVRQVVTRTQQRPTYVRSTTVRSTPVQQVWRRSVPRTRTINVSNFFRGN